MSGASQSPASTRAPIVAAFRDGPEIAWGLTVFLMLAVWRAYTFISTSWQSSPDFRRDYQGIWYFVDYSGGFVRRGLVGQVLRTAGVSASDAQAVFTIATALTVVACILLVGLAVLASWRARTPIAGYTALVLLLTSPLFLALPIRDLGRLDAVGVLLGAGALAVLTPRRVPLAVGVLVATLLVAVATAVEELLFLYLLPVVLCALWMRLRDGEPRRWGALAGWAALLTVPGALIFALSYLRPVSASLAEIVVMKTGGPLYGGGFGSPAWSLTQTTDEGRAFVESFPDHGKTVLLSAIAFLLAAIALYLLMRPSRLVMAAAAYLAAASFAMGMVAVDVQRWWGLALISLAACLVVTSPPAAPGTLEGPQRPRWVRAVLGVAVAGCLALALTPAFPKMGGGFAPWSDLAWRTLFG